jgi:hypothetical protein
VLVNVWNEKSLALAWFMCRHVTELRFESVAWTCALCGMTRGFRYMTQFVALNLKLNSWLETLRLDSWLNPWLDSGVSILDDLVDKLDLV